MTKDTKDRDSKTELLQREIEVEEEEIKKNEKKTKRVFAFTLLAFLFLAANLLYLNYKLIKSKSAISQSSVNNVESTPLVSPSPAEEPTLSPAPLKTIQPQVVEPGLKEYFISFGSGTSTATDWADVGGLQTSFDLSSYGTNIDKILFEASVAVPTANQSVSVRLFNKTDKHPVWNSEVSMSAGDSSYLVSNPIIYDSGAKTYQVQMKTQLGAPANLGQSRLHIILN